MSSYDLNQAPLRDLNRALHALRPDTNETHWTITGPDGRHAIGNVVADGHETGSSRATRVSSPGAISRRLRPATRISSLAMPASSAARSSTAAGE